MILYDWHNYKKKQEVKRFRKVDLNIQNSLPLLLAQSQNSDNFLLNANAKSVILFENKGEIQDFLKIAN
jgi:hypothetical protein